MLRSVRDLRGYAIGASDGDIGKVVDLYFDDEAWVLRYLAVDTATAHTRGSPTVNTHPCSGTLRAVEDAPNIRAIGRPKLVYMFRTAGESESRQPPR